MSRPPSPTSPTTGLRERKKARTRATLQETALRLFHEQGYEQTTVEQIAAAAEVSPSTFFRYFPTKEEVVLYDALDPLLIKAFRAQPTRMSPSAAMRAAMHHVFDALTPEQVADQRERAALALRVPALQNAWIAELLRNQRMICELLAERTGHDRDDFEIRVHAGALLGALLAILLPGSADDNVLEGDFISLTDAALDLVDAGLPLLRRRGPVAPKAAKAVGR
jgi:AcrR family transcriptional regulator